MAVSNDRLSGHDDVGDVGGTGGEDGAGERVARSGPGHSRRVH